MKRIWLCVIGIILAACAIIMVLAVRYTPRTGFHLGKWQRETGGVTDTLEITPDRTVRFSFESNGADDSARYKVLKKTRGYTEIAVQEEGETAPMVFRAYDEVMVNYAYLYKLHKYSGSYRKREIYGTWEMYGETRMLNIFDDGTLSFGFDDYNYEQTGSVYVVKDIETGKTVNAFDYDGEYIYIMVGAVYYRDANLVNSEE